MFNELISEDIHRGNIFENLQDELKEPSLLSSPLLSHSSVCIDDVGDSVRVPGDLTVGFHQENCLLHSPLEENHLQRKGTDLQTTFSLPLSHAAKKSRHRPVAPDLRDDRKDGDGDISPSHSIQYHLGKSPHSASDDVIRMNQKQEKKRCENIGGKGESGLCHTDRSVDADGEECGERKREERGGRGKDADFGRRRRAHARSHQGVLRRRTINVATTHTTNTPHARIQSQSRSLPPPPQLLLSVSPSLTAAQSHVPADDERRRARETTHFLHSRSLPPPPTASSSVLHSSDVRSLTPEPENPAVGMFHLYPPGADVVPIARSLTPEIGTAAPIRAKHRMMSDRRRRLISSSPLQGVSMSSASSFIPSAASSFIPPSHYVSERGAPSTEEEEEGEGREREEERERVEEREEREAGDGRPSPLSMESRDSVDSTSSLTEEREEEREEEDSEGRGELFRTPSFRNEKLMWERRMRAERERERERGRCRRGRGPPPEIPMSRDEMSPIESDHGALSSDSRIASSYSESSDGEVEAKSSRTRRFGGRSNALKSAKSDTFLTLYQSFPGTCTETDPRIRSLYTRMKWRTAIRKALLFHKITSTLFGHRLSRFEDAHLLSHDFIMQWLICMTAHLFSIPFLHPFLVLFILLITQNISYSNVFQAFADVSRSGFPLSSLLCGASVHVARTFLCVTISLIFRHTALRFFSITTHEREGKGGSVRVNVFLSFFGTLLTSLLCPLVNATLTIFSLLLIVRMVVHQPVGFIDVLYSLHTESDGILALTLQASSMLFLLVVVRFLSFTFFAHHVALSSLYLLFLPLAFSTIVRVSLGASVGPCRRPDMEVACTESFQCVGALYMCDGIRGLFTGFWPMFWMMIPASMAGVNI